MKILFSSYHNPNFITITEYVERAIEKSDNTLISFDDQQFILPGRLRNHSNLLRQFDLNNLNNRLIKTTCKSKPDLFLVAGGHRIFPETVKKIKSMGIKPVLWTIDAPLDFQPIIKAAPYYDYVFCGGTEAIELLDRAGIKKIFWLPFACDPDVHKPVELSDREKDKYAHDIVFVGSFYPNRAEVLEKLVDFDLGLYGPGWQKLPERSPLKSCIKGASLKPDEWIKIFSSAKIVLIIHYKNSEDNLPCYQASPKVYENLSCGAFTIVDAQKDVISLFNHEEHLVVYKNIDDLKRLIQYFLENPDKRKKIAEKGRKHVFENHTYLHRIKKMLDIITEKGKKNV